MTATLTPVGPATPVGPGTLAGTSGLYVADSTPPHPLVSTLTARATIESTITAHAVIESTMEVSVAT